MKSREFTKIVNSRIKSIKHTLNVKGIEYATDKDRLHNFKRAAKLMDCTPEEALIGFFMKHFTSILDMVDNIEYSAQHASFAWDEKLGDCINYLILLEALVIERKVTDMTRPKVDKILSDIAGVDDIAPGDDDSPCGGDE